MGVFLTIYLLLTLYLLCCILNINNKGYEKKSKQWDMIQRALMVRKSTEYIVENGLGAAYRLLLLYRLRWECPL